MKSALIFVSLFCLILLAALIWMRQGAQSEMNRMDSERTVLSTQLAAAKVTQADMESQLATLKTNLTMNGGFLEKMSNRIDSVRADLAKNQQERQSIGEELARAQSLNRQLEEDRRAFVEQVEKLTRSVQTSEATIADLQRRVQAGDASRELLTNEIARLESELDQLTRQFNNPDIVRSQLERLEKRAEELRRSKVAQNGTNRLELQPDGTVRLVKPGSAQ